MIAAARAAVTHGFERWANPSSPHAPGRAARAALEDARRRVAAALDWDGEVILTSGASEAIAIAIGRAKADAVLMSTVEHDAVRRAGGGGAYNIPVGDDGLVAADALTGRLGALGAKSPLVAIQTVNSETGVIQPLDRLGAVVRDAGGILFADASQSAGKLPLPDAPLDRAVRPQIGCAAGNRRAAGQESCVARCDRRAGAGLPRRHRKPARHARPCRRAGSAARLDPARRRSAGALRCCDRGGRRRRGRAQQPAFSAASPVTACPGWRPRRS